MYVCINRVSLCSSGWPRTGGPQIQGPIRLCHLSADIKSLATMLEWINFKLLWIKTYLEKFCHCVTLKPLGHSFKKNSLIHGGRYWYVEASGQFEKVGSVLLQCKFWDLTRLSGLVTSTSEPPWWSRITTFKAIPKWQSSENWRTKIYRAQW